MEVDFSEIRNPRVHDNELCEVTVHLKKHFVKAHAASTDQVAALDLVIDKVEHQVTRLKERKVDRMHKPRRRRLAPPPPIDDWEARSLPGSDAADRGDGNGTVDGAEVAEIIRTKQFTSKPMTVEEAALQMDLLGHDFYLFKDAQTGHATGALPASRRTSRADRGGRLSRVRYENRRRKRARIAREPPVHSASWAS